MKSSPCVSKIVHAASGWIYVIRLLLHLFLTVFSFNFQREKKFLRCFALNCSWELKTLTSYHEFDSQNHWMLLALILLSFCGFCCKIYKNIMNIHFRDWNLKFLLALFTWCSFLLCQICIAIIAFVSFWQFVYVSWYQLCAFHVAFPTGGISFLLALHCVLSEKTHP